MHYQCKKYPKIKGKEFVNLKKPVKFKEREHFAVPWKQIGDYGILYKITDQYNGKFRDPNCGILNELWQDLLSCFQKERLNLYQRIDHFCKGTQDSVGLRCIPSILNISDRVELIQELQKHGNIQNLLAEKNLEKYSIGNDVMHILCGHIKNLYEAISTESGFDKKEAENAINHILSRLSSKSRWSFSDWRFVFYQYEKSILPFIQRDIGSAKWVLFSLNQVQKGLYCKLEKWDENMKCSTLVNILVHFISVIDRFGNKILKMHLHILSTHIPQDINNMKEIPLSIIYSELCEQIFHFLKNISANMTNHDKIL